MANKKIDIAEKRAEAENAGNEQFNDLASMIASLGSSSAPEPVTETEESEQPVSVRTVHTVKKTSAPARSKAPTADQVGYVSLVIPTKLKKQWKTYSAEHGLSLTDCIKLGMHLIEELEAGGSISIDNGIITWNNN